MDYAQELCHKICRKTYGRRVVENPTISETEEVKGRQKPTGKRKRKKSNKAAICQGKRIPLELKSFEDEDEEEKVKKLMGDNLGLYGCATAHYH